MTIKSKLVEVAMAGFLFSQSTSLNASYSPELRRVEIAQEISQYPLPLNEKAHDWALVSPPVNYVVVEKTESERNVGKMDQEEKLETENGYNDLGRRRVLGLIAVFTALAGGFYGGWLYHRERRR